MRESPKREKLVPVSGTAAINWKFGPKKPLELSLRNPVLPDGNALPATLLSPVKETPAAVVMPLVFVATASAPVGSYIPIT